MVLVTVMQMIICMTVTLIPSFCGQTGECRVTETPTYWESGTFKVTVMPFCVGEPLVQLCFPPMLEPKPRTYGAGPTEPWQMFQVQTGWFQVLHLPPLLVLCTSKSLLSGLPISFCLFILTGFWNLLQAEGRGAEFGQPEIHHSSDCSGFLILLRPPGCGVPYGAWAEFGVSMLAGSSTRLEICGFSNVEGERFLAHTRFPR